MSEARKRLRAWLDNGELFHDDYGDVIAVCEEHERMATALGRALKLVESYAWTGRKQDVVACPWCYQVPDTIETHAPDCEVAAVLADPTGQAALAERTNLLRRVEELEAALGRAQAAVLSMSRHFTRCPECGPWIDEPDRPHTPECPIGAALAAQPERAPEPAGLFGKYIISKADGSPVDPNARYFVLRYDTDPYAWSAVLRYAQSVSEENPELAGDILGALQTVPPPEHPKLRRAAQSEREAQDG